MRMAFAARREVADPRAGPALIATVPVSKVLINHHRQSISQ